MGPREAFNRPRRTGRITSEAKLRSGSGRRVRATSPYMPTFHRSWLLKRAAQSATQRLSKAKADPLQPPYSHTARRRGHTAALGDWPMIPAFVVGLAPADDAWLPTRRGAPPPRASSPSLPRDHTHGVSRGSSLHSIAVGRCLSLSAGSVFSRHPSPPGPPMTACLWTTTAPRDGGRSHSGIGAQWIGIWHFSPRASRAVVGRKRSEPQTSTLSTVLHLVWVWARPGHGTAL